jgi:4-amino-4-deoxy-L-arabinose transferase-like glycosyltransferase
MRSDRWLTAVILVAVVLRVAAAVAIGDRFHFADEAVYLDTARRLLHGEGFPPGYSQTPGYPLFLAMLSALLPDSVLAVRLAQGILAGLGSALVYALGERLAGRGPALLAAAIYAVDPLLVVTAGLLYAETVAALLVTIAVLAAWRAGTDSPRSSALAGAFMGILALVRPVGLALVPVVTVWIAAKVPFKRAGLHMAVVVAATLLALAPWTYRNYRVHGRFTPIAEAGTHMAPVTPREIAEDGLTVSILRKLWKDPVGVAGRTTRQFVQFWELTPTRLATDDPKLRSTLRRNDSRLPTTALVAAGPRDLVSMIASILEFALALVGLVLLWRKRPSAAVLITGVTVAFAFGYALFVAKLRYRIPILPLLFVLAGIGAWRLSANARVRGEPGGGRDPGVAAS